MLTEEQVTMVSTMSRMLQKDLGKNVTITVEGEEDEDTGHIDPHDLDTYEWYSIEGQDGTRYTLKFVGVQTNAEEHKVYLLCSALYNHFLDGIISGQAVELHDGDIITEATEEDLELTKAALGL